MMAQRVELAGKRFVIVAEEDFLRLERRAQEVSAKSGRPRPNFAPVTPLKTKGTPASEILIRDRR
jgi:hypothetical protein